MLKFLILIFSLALATACFADFSLWVVVPVVSAQDVSDRLDSLIEPGSEVSHYSPIIRSPVPGYSFVCFQVEPRAQSVLTPEEWATRSTHRPAEFPFPTPF